MRRPSRRLLALPALAALVLGLSCWIPASALAGSNQVDILQDDPMFLSNPVGTMQQARDLGVGDVRLMMRWQALAPNANSFHAPAHFHGSDPAAYSDSAWAPFDAVVNAAYADGVTVDLDLLGGAPLWATGPGMPHGSGYPFHNWEPSAAAYGQFVRAVATRYSGYYDPKTHKTAPGNADDLPRVQFWSIYNEPDYGPSLAPQAVPRSKSVPLAPRLYRGLADQAWAALNATGHGSDTIVFGELAPRGTLTFGNFNGMTPLVFMRALYCVNGSYRPLRGAAATQLGCPTTVAASNRFAAQNPVLFKASGVSDHPYMRWYPPNQEQSAYQPAHFKQLLPNYTTLATIGHLESALNRLLGAYHVKRAMPVWNTEFGYITSPPKRRTKTDHYPWASQATAAYYDNWAEYISYKDRRLSSFDQYLLQDSLPALPTNDEGGFASGLINYSGKPKPGYGAFRMPLFLPVTSAASGHSFEVWGAVKPARYAWMDQPASVQTVSIMFAPAGSTSFSPLQTVTLNPSSPEGYFDTHVQFPSSGTVELQWTYPQDSLLADAGQTATSRQVQVTVK